MVRPGLSPLDRYVPRAQIIPIADNIPFGRRRLRDTTVLPLVREAGRLMSAPSPKTPHDYRARADECERLAAGATSPEVREIMLYAARRWRGLADEDEARRKSVKPQAQASSSPD